MATYKIQCNRGGHPERFILLLDVVIGDQIIERNQSWVYTTLRLAGGNYAGDNYNPYGSSFTGYKCNGTVKIRNNTSGEEITGNGSSSGSVSNTSAIQIAEGGGWFTHNADGTLTVEITGTFTGGLSTHTSGGTISVNFQVPTLPRATACPTGAYQVGISHYIPLNSASPNFTHALDFTLGDRRFWLEGDSRGITLDLTNKDDIYSLFSTMQSVCPAVLHTYSNGTWVGSSNGTIYINSMEADCRPEVSGSYQDINEQVFSIIDPENRKKILRNKSIVKINISSQAHYSSINYFTINGTNIGNISEFVDGQPNVVNYQLIAYDYRGYASIPYNIQVDLRDYTALTCEPNFFRTQPTNNEIALWYQGTFSSYLADIENAITTAWYYKRSDETNWTLGGSSIAPTNITWNWFNFETRSLGQDYDYNYSYTFRIVISDLIDTISIDKIVTRGKADFYSNGQKFGVNAEFFLKNIHILDYVFPIGSYYVSYDGGNPSGKYGGQWEQNFNGTPIKTEQWEDAIWYGTYEIYDNGYMKITGTTKEVEVSGNTIKQVYITPKYEIIGDYGIVVTLAGATYQENLTTLGYYENGSYVVSFNNLRSAQTSQYVRASFTSTAIIDLSRYGLTQRTYKRIG